MTPRRPKAAMIHAVYCGCSSCNKPMRWWELAIGAAAMLAVATIIVVMW